MNIGVFGGSFDPPHICHVLACHYALAMAELDKVVVIPCYRHPLGKTMAPYEDRLEMCRLAFADLGGSLEVSDIESRLGEVSYTIDTLRALAGEHPGAQWRLIVGSDILDEASRWKDFGEIQRAAPLLVLPRGASAPSESPFQFPDLSSTAIRDALSRGEASSETVPRRVLDFVKSRSLYE